MNFLVTANSKPSFCNRCLSSVPGILCFRLFCFVLYGFVFRPQERGAEPYRPRTDSRMPGRTLRCFLFPGDVRGAEGRSQGEISEGGLHGLSQGAGVVSACRINDIMSNRVILLDIVYPGILYHIEYC